MLAHAEIVVRAPDGDLVADPVIEGPRKAAATPFEIGEDAVPPLGPQHIEALFEEAFVIHCRYGYQILDDKASRSLSCVVGRERPRR